MRNGKFAIKLGLMVLGGLALMGSGPFSCNSGGGGSAAPAAATAPAATPTPVPWHTKQLGVASLDTAAFAVTHDSSSAIIAAGWTDGNLAGNTLTGSIDMQVTKYDSSGTRQWTKLLGAVGGTAFGQGVAADSAGNVYVTGYTTNGLDGNTQTGSSDYFLVKYNSSGVKQWTKQFGEPGGNDCQAFAVTVDSSDNVYITGYTMGGLDGNTLTGITDVFLIKFNSSGTKQWTKELGVASAATFGQAIARDSSDNIFIAGITYGGLDGNTLTASVDFFVTKYNSSGVKQWTKQLGVAAKGTQGYAVVADSAGNVYVSGSTAGGLDGNTLAGTTDFFLTKYNSSGVKQWTKQLGVATKDTYGTSLTRDSSDNIYVGGYTSGGLDGNTLAGNSDYTLVKYNSSGTKQWTKQVGVAAAYTQAMGVTCDSSENIFAAGATQGGLDGNTVTGTSDLWVTKYNTSGVEQ